MRKTFLINTLLAAVIATSCGKKKSDETSDTISAEKFTPPSGKATGTYDADGPGPRRILLATSSDGLTFTRKGQLLTDQGNTPNMLVLDSGRILVYYTGYNLDGGSKDGIAVAVSDDKGSTWAYYKASMNGFPSGHASIGDPDIIKLSDGTYRMYVTNGGSDQKIYIISTTSSDGFNFTKEGTALDMSSSNYKDSLTSIVGSTYYMYTLRSDKGYMALASSSDGKTFTNVGESSRDISNKQYVLSNWLKTNSGYRIFAFSGENYDIRSFTTTDGKTLTADTTVSLGTPLSSLEKSWVKDAAVQKLSDGTYLMAYVAEIP